MQEGDRDLRRGLAHWHSKYYLSRVPVSTVPLRVLTTVGPGSVPESRSSASAPRNSPELAPDSDATGRTGTGQGTLNDSMY